MLQFGLLAIAWWKPLLSPSRFYQLLAIAERLYPFSGRQDSSLVITLQEFKMSKNEKTGKRNDGTWMEYGDDKPQRIHKALTVGPQFKTGPLKQTAPQQRKTQPKKAKSK